MYLLIKIRQTKKKRKKFNYGNVKTMLKQGNRHRNPKMPNVSINEYQKNSSNPIQTSVCHVIFTLWFCLCVTCCSHSCSLSSLAVVCLYHNCERHSHKTLQVVSKNEGVKIAMVWLMRQEDPFSTFLFNCEVQFLPPSMIYLYPVYIQQPLC